MKKFAWIILLASTLCLAAFSACNKPDDDLPSGELQFTLYNYSREYQVTGLGTFDGDEVDVPATYDGKNVTSIGENAFSGSAITKITLPQTVTEICAGAFSDCFALTQITISDQIETIKENAFLGADALAYTAFGGGKYLGNEQNPHLLLVKAADKSASQITIHQNAKIICNSAFSDCDGISDLIIPDGVIKIEDYAFWGCDNLVSVTLGSGLKEIEDHAFLDCNKIVEVFNRSDLNIKRGQRTNTGYVAYNALKVYAGDAESSIVTDANGYKIFVDGDTNVLVGYEGKESDITLPDGVSIINKRAFYGNQSITSVTAKDGLTEIGLQAFSNCSKLQTINLPDTTQIIGTQAFFDCAALKNISFGKQLKEIGDYAFGGCAALENISLPENLSEFGNAPFAGCSGLKSFEIDAANKNYQTINGVLYTKDLSMLIQYPAGGADAAFSVPDSVKAIGASAFSGAKNLSTITIGSAVEIIDAAAFKDSAISEIKFNGKNTLRTVGSSAFSGCKNLTSAMLPDSVTSLGESAFSGCESLSAVSINGITEIGGNTFFGCKNLTEITVPDGVGSIGAKAFSGCERLSAVNIGEQSKIFGFGQYCFENCKSLTEITIPKSTQNIQKWAFSGCESLKYVYFKDDGWWAWNKGYESIGVDVHVDPEGAAQDLVNYRCKYLWQNKNVK